MQAHLKYGTDQLVNIGEAIYSSPGASWSLGCIDWDLYSLNLQSCKACQKKRCGEPHSVNFPVEPVRALLYTLSLQSSGQLFVIDLPLSHFLLKEMPSSFFPRCPHFRFWPFLQVSRAFHSPYFSIVRAYVRSTASQIGHIRPIRNFIARLALYDRICKLFV